MDRQYLGSFREVAIRRQHHGNFADRSDRLEEQVGIGVVWFYDSYSGSVVLLANDIQ